MSNQRDTFEFPGHCQQTEVKMICLSALPAECLLRGYVLLLIMQADKKMYFARENCSPGALGLHFQSTQGSAWWGCSSGDQSPPGCRGQR